MSRKQPNCRLLFSSLVVLSASLSLKASYSSSGSKVSRIKNPTIAQVRGSDFVLEVGIDDELAISMNPQRDAVVDAGCPESAYQSRFVCGGRTSKRVAVEVHSVLFRVVVERAKGDFMEPLSGSVSCDCDGERQFAQ